VVDINPSEFSEYADPAPDTEEDEGKLLLKPNFFKDKVPGFLANLHGYFFAFPACHFKG
jgi:hypothetical protein